MEINGVLNNFYYLLAKLRTDFPNESDTTLMVITTELIKAATNLEIAEQLSSIDNTLYKEGVIINILQPK